MVEDIPIPKRIRITVGMRNLLRSLSFVHRFSICFVSLVEFSRIWVTAILILSFKYGPDQYSLHKSGPPRHPLKFSESVGAVY